MKIFNCLSICSALLSGGLQAQNLSQEDVSTISTTVEQSLKNGILKEIKDLISAKTSDSQKVAQISEAVQTLENNAQVGKLPLVDVSALNAGTGCTEENDYGILKYATGLGGNVLIYCTPNGWRVVAPVPL